MIEFAIEVLTKLYIELSFEEKNTGKKIYVKKTEIYKDLIKFLKTLKNS